MSALTHVFENRGLPTMRAAALNLLSSLSWRHHGIGMLQGYLVEKADPEVRMHIWHPDLVKPAILESGNIHDHRFDMVSHVLAGNIAHDEILVRPDADGTHETLVLTHARAAKDNAYNGPTTPTGCRYEVRRNSMIIPTGSSYSFAAGNFHCSPVLDGVAVTLVEKHNQSATPARVLHPVDIEPIMAFGHDIDPNLLTRVLELTRVALAGRKQ